MVDLMVRLMPLDILVTILYRRDGENRNQRENNETGGDGGEFREELEDRNGEEEDIGDPSKLLQQVSREESDDGVFRCDILIRPVEMILEDSSLQIEEVGGERCVYVDRPWWRRFPLSRPDGRRI